MSRPSRFIPGKDTGCFRWLGLLQDPSGQEKESYHQRGSNVGPSNLQPVCTSTVLSRPILYTPVTGDSNRKSRQFIFLFRITQLFNFQTLHIYALSLLGLLILLSEISSPHGSKKSTYALHPSFLLPRSQEYTFFFLIFHPDKIFCENCRHTSF